MTPSLRMQYNQAIIKAWGQVKANAYLSPHQIKAPTIKEAKAFPSIAVSSVASFMFVSGSPTSRILHESHPQFHIETWKISVLEGMPSWPGP